MQTVSTKLCMRPKADELFRRSVESSSSGSMCCEAAFRQRIWSIADGLGTTGWGLFAYLVKNHFAKRGFGWALRIERSREGWRALCSRVCG